MWKPSTWQVLNHLWWHLNGLSGQCVVNGLAIQSKCKVFQSLQWILSLLTDCTQLFPLYVWCVGVCMIDGCAIVNVNWQLVLASVYVHACTGIVRRD